MDSSLDYTVADYLNALRRRGRALSVVAIPILVGAALMSALLPDQYTSYSEIDIDLEGSSVSTLEPIEMATYADQYIVKLENRVLTKENLLALANDPELFSKSENALTDSGRVRLIRNSVEVSVVTQSVLSPRDGREVELISGMKVASVSGNPEFAFKVADHLAGLFLQADRQSRTEQAGSTMVFLNEQMKITEDEILALEKKVADFKVANACCLPELVGLNTSVIQRAERDIESSQPRIRSLEQSRKFLQTQLDELGQLDTTTNRVNELEQEYMTLVAKYGSNHPDVVRLRREIIALSSADSGGGDSLEIIELRTKLSDAEQRYSNEHPDVIRYKKELAALESRRTAADGAPQNKLLANPRYNQLRAELNTIDTQLIELRRSQPALRNKIEEYESRLARTPQIESEYVALSRSLESARSNFDDLQQRAVVARQSEALESTDIGARLVQAVSAELPQSPSGPPRAAILVLGAFLAATFGIGSVLFAEMSDNTVRGSKDVARVMNMVPLGTIPVIESVASRRQHQRQLNLMRGAGLVIITVIILFYFIDFF